jgi:dTDP-4-dehydrorhamnose reductase
LNRRVLIIGASGFIGYSLYKVFRKNFDVLGTYYSNKIANLKFLDFLDESQLVSIIKDFDPKIILLPAALPNVEYCEKNSEECWKYNVEAPMKIINQIKNLNIKLVFYSSDYIFDGQNGPYSEISDPNPLNEYGKCKLETETRIINNLKNYLIIRTTVVYGFERNRKNFIYRLIDTLNKGIKIKVPYDQIGTPTYVDNLSEATLKLIEKDRGGIFNIVGSDLLSRYKFSLIAAKVFNLNKKLIIPVQTSELNQKAERPLNAGLKIDKLLANINIKMYEPPEGLIDLQKKMVMLNESE